MENKIRTLRFRAVNRDIFLAIKTGKKKVETRAATLRYRHIKVGDEIKLTCGKSSLQKKVGKVRIFRTIPAMLKVYRVKSINPNIKSAEELKALYYSFSGYREKIEKYGLIALGLE